MNTTWKGKNRPLIEEAMREAWARGMKHPTLTDIAPGAVTRLLAPYFPEKQSHLTSILKPIDYALRLTRKFPVTCPEVEEILHVFAPLEPAHLAVLYADEDVAEAFPESDLVLMNPANIDEDIIPELGDVVFCYNAISKAPNPKRSLENLLHSVKLGGLLSINTETDWSLNPRTDPLFIGLSDNLFVKEF